MPKCLIRREYFGEGFGYIPSPLFAQKTELWKAEGEWTQLLLLNKMVTL